MDPLRLSPLKLTWLISHNKVYNLVQVCETVSDFLPLLLRLPFVRVTDDAEHLAEFMDTIKLKWQTTGGMLEKQLNANRSGFFVGSEISAADILVAHCATWLVEEVRCLRRDLFCVKCVSVDLACLTRCHA